MPTTTVRSLSALAALAWLVVGGYGVWEILVEDSGDDWETSYTIFTCALALGSILSVLAVRNVSSAAGRAPMRSIGLGLCVLGVVITVVGAWALPLWMTLLAAGFALVAASGSAWRRPVALLAASHLLGMGALFVGIAAEVGRVDEYGDHPAAFGIGLVATAAATLVSLQQLGRGVEAGAPGGAPRVGATAA